MFEELRKEVFKESLCSEITKDPFRDSLSAWEKQIGGNHYKNFAIQPTEFCMKNKLNPLQFHIIKRICRYNLKGTPLEDLEKAKHEIDMLIEFENLKEAVK